MIRSSRAKDTYEDAYLVFSLEMRSDLDETRPSSLKRFAKKGNSGGVLRKYEKSLVFNGLDQALLHRSKGRGRILVDKRLTLLSFDGSSRSVLPASRIEYRLVDRQKQGEELRLLTKVTAQISTADRRHWR